MPSQRKISLNINNSMIPDKTTRGGGRMETISLLFPKDINLSCCEPSGRRGRALLLQIHSVSPTFNLTHRLPFLS